LSNAEPGLPRLAGPIDRAGCRLILAELVAFHDGAGHALNDARARATPRRHLTLDGGVALLVQLEHCIRGIAADMMPVCPDGYTVLQLCPTCDDGPGRGGGGE
jgi:hypothetical protein